jgi:hypothetical protein
MRRAPSHTRMAPLAPLTARLSHTFTDTWDPLRWTPIVMLQILSSVWAADEIETRQRNPLPQRNDRNTHTSQQSLHTALEASR